MQEVTIRLRFNRACLGYAKKTTRRGGTIYAMPCDASGRVMFLASWWRASFRYAAKVVGQHYDHVGQIDWDPIVDGRISEWRRIISQVGGVKRRSRYALHEAFRPGDVIGVNAVLPNELTLDAFMELLTVVGAYKGISPFQSHEEVYGTFEVVSVCPTVRSRRTSTNGNTSLT